MQGHRSFDEQWKFCQSIIPSVQLGQLWTQPEDSDVNSDDHESTVHPETESSPMLLQEKFYG